MTPTSDSTLPVSVRRALARATPGGGMSAIKHVVLLMQENRSFDHYFGTFPGVRGLADPNAIKQRNGHSIFDQKSGASPPYRLADDGSGDSGTPHDWTTGHRAWNDGWHDQWVEAKGRETMGYYGPAGVPFYHELAEAFTLCDAYHCSVLSETTSNRNYWFSGYSGFEPKGGPRVIDATAQDRRACPAGYGWASYPEILDAKGVGWRVYQEWDNYYDNNLEFHQDFKRIFRAALCEAGLFNNYPSLYDFYEALRGQPDAAAREAMLGALARGVAKLPQADQKRYERGLARCAPRWGTTKGLVEEFAKDVAAGTLPQVSYLVPASTDCEHPGDSTPRMGEKLVSQVLDALASHPDVWDSTVLFLSYDENDGLFDHVPPPVPPPEVADEYVEGRPMGLGIRVPLIVVSPWTRGGYVCSQVFDHTSQVQFLEEWLKVQQPLISTWRRTVTGDLTSAFDFTATAPTPRSGGRRARPLPYQPDAHGVFDGSSGRFDLRLSNSRAKSVHFTLFPYAGELSCPAHFDVLTMQEVAVPVTGGAYDFTVTGPNGFRREFTGGSGPAAQLHVTSNVSEEPRVLTLSAENPAATELTLLVTSAHGHSVRKTMPSGGTTTLTWDTEGAEGWYDLTVGVQEDRKFHRRLTGHIENGRESVSG